MQENKENEIDNTPMLSELLDMVDNGTLEGEWFKYYPTKIHQENKSPWWGPRKDIEGLAESRKEKTRYILYGK